MFRPLFSRSLAIASLASVACFTIGASGSSPCSAATLSTATPITQGLSAAATSRTSTSVTSKQPNHTSLYNQLPTSIRASGVITVLTYAGYPPTDFLAPNGSTVIGIDPSVEQVLAKELGVTFKVEELGSFEGLIPALQSGRADVIMSGMTDTKARQKVITFVDYLEIGSGMVTRTGNPDHLTTEASLCGKTVAEVAGTTAIVQTSAQSKQCMATGKPKVAAKLFPGASQALLAVKEGRADVVISDEDISAYYAQQSHGALELVGQQFDVAPYGIATRPNEKQLQTVLQKAVQQAINDGSLAAVVKKWGLTLSAVPKTAAINGATQ